MEYYEKGEVLEVPDTIKLNFCEKCIHMKVAYGSKVKNLIGFALKKIKEPEVSEICWTGYGKGFQKTLSCAEIFRKKAKGLHKVTSLRYKRTEEYWDPKSEGLDRLKVNIDVPAVSVLFTKERTEQPTQSWPKELEEIWRSTLKEIHKNQSSEETSERNRDKKPQRTHSGNKEFSKPNGSGRNSAESVDDNSKSVTDGNPSGKGRPKSGTKGHSNKRNRANSKKSEMQNDDAKSDLERPSTVKGQRSRPQKGQRKHDLERSKTKDGNEKSRTDKNKEHNNLEKTEVKDTSVRSRPERGQGESDVTKAEVSLKDKSKDLNKTVL